LCDFESFPAAAATLSAADNVEGFEVSLEEGIVKMKSDDSSFGYNMFAICCWGMMGGQTNKRTKQD